MAELMLLKEDRGLHWKDGDIAEAFSNLRIRCVHANVICHQKHAGVTSNGLRPNGSLAFTWFENTYQYRFERISKTEVRRVELRTNQLTLVDPTEMAVDQYIRNRLKHPRHRIFGAPGAEVWHGGHKTFDHSRMNVVWANIEAKTPKREVDYRRWPMGTREAEAFVWLNVNDFTEAERAEWLRWYDDDVEVEPAPGVPRVRRYFVPWRDYVPPGLIAAQRRNKDFRDKVSVDSRFDIKGRPRGN